MRFPYLAVFVWLGLTATSALARDKSDLDVVTLRAGTSTFSGGLSDAKAAPTYGLVWQFWRNPELEAHVFDDWWLSRVLSGAAITPLIQVVNVDAPTLEDGLDFPFAPDHATHLTAIDFGWRLCGLTTYAVHPCLVATIGDLAVNQGSRYAQRYAGGALGLSVESFLTRSIYASADVEWRSVSQTYDKKTTYFGIRSQTLGLGWAF